MKFEVFCDESCPEVLMDKSANKYMILGSLWIPADNRENMKVSIKSLKEKFSYVNEIKWNKVAPSTLDFYLELSKYFFKISDFRFRAILVESGKIDLIRFHNDDGELSFYKFYYQLLHHWIYDYNEYSIYVDLKVNKDRNRVGKLWEVLKNANLFSAIKVVQAIPSDESLGIQLTDFLTGCINGKFNQKTISSSKLAVISEIESLLKHPITPTNKAEEKFNIFKINLQGGW